MRIIAVIRKGGFSMVKRIYDEHGRYIFYDGTLPGNCSICGLDMEEDAPSYGIPHEIRCDGPRFCHCNRRVKFVHFQTGRKQYGGQPAQRTLCSGCNKEPSQCDCIPLKEKEGLTIWDKVWREMSNAERVIMLGRPDEIRAEVSRRVDKKGADPVDAFKAIVREILDREGMPQVSV